MWRTCPHAKAVPGARVAYTDEREIQHALDAGALVHRRADRRHRRGSDRGARLDLLPAARPAQQRRRPGLRRRRCGAACPAAIARPINDNIVLILMIETLEGLKNADEIAKVPGVTAIFAASGDLGNFTGYRAGHARLRARDQHRARRGDQGRRAAVRPVRLARSPRLHLLPGRQRDGARSRAAWRAELGTLANTQGKPEVGPFVKQP